MDKTDDFKARILQDSLNRFGRLRDRLIRILIYLVIIDICCDLLHFIVLLKT